MKRALLIIFSLFPSLAIATPVDSMLGPFRLPLTVSVVVNGRFGDTDVIQAKGTYSSSSFAATIHLVADTMLIQNGDTVILGRYSDPQWGSVATRGVLHQDTIRLHQGPFASGEWDDCVIVFDPPSHLIQHISISRDGPTELSGPPETWSIQMSNFRYDSLIYTGDSSTASHSATGGYYVCNTYSHAGQSCTSWSWLSEVYSIDLAGIFRPTHLVNPDLSVAPAEANSALTIRTFDGLLNCTFGASSHPRTIEVFSPLGVRVAANSVAQGETSATLPRLPAGLYFIRLDGALAKVGVSE